MAAIFEGLHRPLLFAHRGASAHAPENTFEAFDLALCLGADVLEMDVHPTKDGQIVVIHDARLERTTDGSGWVREHSLAELQRLDAGYRFKVGDDLRFRGRGTRLETLEATLTNFSRAAFNIELKEPGMARGVLAALERAGVSRVVLTAGDDAIMRELEAARPGVPLGLSAGQCWSILRGSYVGGVPKGFAGRAMQVPPRYGVVPVARPRLIQAVHAAGMELHLWVLNDPRAAQRWLERGVDGIMSDDPGALTGVFFDFREKQMGRPSRRQAEAPR